MLKKNYSLPQLLPGFREKDRSPAKRLRFDKFLFEDNFTKKKMKPVVYEKLQRPILGEKAEGEEEEMEQFLDQWKQYLKIKKFQQDAVMEQVRVRASELKSSGQEQPATRKTDIYKIKRMIREKIFQINRSQYEKYLKGQAKFDKKQELMNKLYFGAGSFRDMLALTKDIFRQQQRGEDLFSIINQSSLQSEKRTQKQYMRERRQKLRESLVHKEQQEEALIDQYSRQFLDQLKLNINVRRLFLGGHLINPTIEQVHSEGIPSGSLFATELRLFADPIEIDAQWLKATAFKSTQQKFNKAEIQSLRSRLQQTKKKLELTDSLNAQEKWFLKMIKQKQEMELLKYIDKASKDSLLKIKDKWGNTPLHYAAKFGHQNIIKAVLGVGFDPDQKNCLGHSPNLLAKRLRNQDYFKVMQQLKTKKRDSFYVQ